LYGKEVFSRITLTLIFCFSSLLCAADDQAGRNIRLRDRQAGLYLTPAVDPTRPEAHNFTTTGDPLAPLDINAIAGYLTEHPELKDYRIVIIGPAVGGDEASDFKSAAQRTLDEIGVDTDVQIIRHPKTLKEKILNLIPRREDYEAPIPAELRVAGVKIVLAESLSFAVLLLPPILKIMEVEASQQIGEVLDQIRLPLSVALPMVVLDVANMVPLVSYRRALSNHNIRLNGPERFGRQFIMSMFFSFNFYITSQWPQIWQFFETAGGENGMLLTALGATAKMLSIIVPASIFNMLSRTTVGTSLNIWEQRSENRRFWVAMMEAVTGLVIAPLYILSTMPVLEPVVSAGVMNLNAAHLGMLGMGAAGGVAWATLERDKWGEWARGVRDCGAWIARRLRRAPAKGN